MANKKISQLTSLANISDTTILPVVDSGTSYKTTMANVKSFIGAASNSYVANAIANITWANLSGAPNISNYATTANLGNLSNTVANITWANLSGAPNISNYATTANLGNLSNTVANITWANLSGKPTIPSSLANLGITDGTSGQVLTTDGSGNFTFSTPAASSSYANSNVASYLPTFTGNLTAGNANLGNAVTANYFIGNGSQLTGLPASYANSNVANYLPTFTGNLTAGNANLGNLASANYVTVSGNVVVGGGSGGNITGANNIAANAVSTIKLTANGNVTLGSISNVHITGGTSGHVLSTDGTGTLSWVAQSSSANTGNITFSDTTMTSTNGDVKIHFSPSASPAVEFNFASNGALTLPQGGTITEGGGLTGAIKLTPAGGANDNQALLIYPTAAADGDHIHLTAGGGSTELYLGNDFHYVKLVDGGNVEIRADNEAGSGASWEFGTNGNTSFPNGLVIKGNEPTIRNTVDDTLYLYGYDSPNGEGGDIRLYAGRGTSGQEGGEVRVRTHNANNDSFTWHYKTDGSLTLPIGVSIDNSVSPLYPKIIADSDLLFSVQGQGSTGSAALAWTVDPNAASQYAAVGVSRAGDNLAKVVLQAQSDSGDVATAKTWKFDETGTLTLPSNASEIRYANGTNILAGYALSSAIPIPTFDNSSAGDMDVMIYDGNLKYTSNVTINASTGHLKTAGDISIQGNLNVVGTTVTTNQTTLNVSDHVITLNSGTTGTPSFNASIAVDRGTSADTSLRWNEISGKWEQTRDGSTFVDIPVNTTELSEGTNLYYTNARARTAISVTGSGSYDNTTGVITVTGGVTSVNTKTGTVTINTDDVSEGSTNQYFTTTRSNTAFDNKLATKTTDNVTEGTTNKYFTTTRVNSAMAAFTGNLTAGNASLGNLASATYISGNGSLLTALTGANVTGTVGNATHATVADSANTVTWGNVSSKPTTISGYGITDSYGNSNTASYLPTYTGNIASGNISVTGNIAAGNISATGTITYNNVTNQNVTDNKVTLNFGTTGAPSLSAGIVVARGTSSNTELRWNESIDKWQQTRDGSTYVDIPINTTELSEGTNLYYTDTRANTAFDNRLATKSTTNLTEGTNLYYTDTRANTAFDNKLATKTTTNLTEGTNLYFTNARARTTISVTGSGSYDNTTGVITVTGGVTSVNTKTGAVTLSTTDVSEGTNLYYTDTRANTAFDNKLATKSTTNLTEGTNLYYTDTRANTAFDARLAVKSTSNVAEGTNLYFTNARANSAMAAFTGNLTAGNASVTANISGGNLSISGISTVTGNITGGNINSGGQANITGNITGANLIAGSSGQGNVYAGNVIVNGQPTTYGTVNPAFMVVGLASSVNGFGSGSTVIFDTVVGNTNSQTSYNASTGVFTLTAGVTYDMSFTPSFITFTNPTTGYLCYQWVDATTNTPLDSTGTGMGTGISSQDTTAQQDNTTARVIYTPNTNQTVKLLVTAGNGTVTLRGSIGTQAIVRPLNLSIAVQATATGTVSATVVANTSPVSGTNFNGGSNASPALTVLTLAIPTAGTWRLDAEMRVYIPGEGYMAAAFYDNGTLIPGSEYFIAAGGVTQTGAATGQYGGFMSYNLTTTGARTVTMGAWATGTSQFITSGDGRTWARATQIDSIFALNTLGTMSTTGNVSVGGNLSLTGSFQGLTPSYTFVDDSASASWWLLGTWNTVQSGQTLYMRIVSHAGYNAVANQNQVTELMWSASNGTSTYNGSTGSPMLGAGSASVNSRLGTGGVTYQSPGSFRIVQVSSTQYQVYGYFGSYTRGATYSVQTSTLCTWVHSGTAVSAPSGNYVTITPTSF